MNSYASQQTIIAALRDPHCYPHDVASVTILETHISWVLLAGEYAYKIKKALDLAFLDYSTLATRRFFCDEEVRLADRTIHGLACNPCSNMRSGCAALNRIPSWIACYCATRSRRGTSIAWPL